MVIDRRKYERLGGSLRPVAIRMQRRMRGVSVSRPTAGGKGDATGSIDSRACVAVGSRARPVKACTGNQLVWLPVLSLTSWARLEPSGPCVAFGSSPRRKPPVTRVRTRVPGMAESQTF
jgi:hypothetical protein